MRTTASAFCLLIATIICAHCVHAGNQPGNAVKVLDGDTIMAVGVDASGKESGKPGTMGIRGIVAPALDQPFGRQAHDRLKELVEGKGVLWNGPVPRAHKQGFAVFFRAANGDSLAKLMLSEGLAWVVEAELEDKHAKPSDVRKLVPDAAAWISAEREAREAKRGLWADKEPVPPWEWRAKMKEIKNSLGMRLMYIPPGKFLMGSPQNEPGREASELQHEVEITKGFYLGATEVTVGQFKQFVADTNYRTSGEIDGKGGWGSNPDGGGIVMGAQYTWKSPGFQQTDDHPVVVVSWTDASEFCRWLAKKENKEYRLPTEAEWEYACRAGTKTAYSSGDTPEGLAAIGINVKDGQRFTAPVGGFQKNGFGLYNMHGNVWEWCQDWYDPKGYTAGRQTDPTGPATGTAKVQRGGGWSSGSSRWRSAARIGRESVAYRGCYQGFRVALPNRAP